MPAASMEGEKNVVTAKSCVTIARARMLAMLSDRQVKEKCQKQPSRGLRARCKNEAKLSLQRFPSRTEAACPVASGRNSTSDYSRVWPFIFALRS